MGKEGHLELSKRRWQSSLPSPPFSPSFPPHLPSPCLNRALGKEVKNTHTGHHLGHSFSGNNPHCSLLPREPHPPLYPLGSPLSVLPALQLLGSSLARKTVRPEGLAGLALQPLAQASMEPESSGGLAWPPGILPAPFTLHTGLPSQCMAGALFPERALVPEAVPVYGEFSGLDDPAPVWM